MLSRLLTAPQRAARRRRAPCGAGEQGEMRGGPGQIAQGFGFPANPTVPQGAACLAFSTPKCWHRPRASPCPCGNLNHNRGRGRAQAQGENAAGEQHPPSICVLLTAATRPSLSPGDLLRKEPGRAENPGNPRGAEVAAGAWPGGTEHPKSWARTEQLSPRPPGSSCCTARHVKHGAITLWH